MRKPCPSILLELTLQALVISLLLWTALGQNTTNEALAPTSAPAPDTSSTCSCTDCPNEETVALGLHHTLLSPECPEGSVATVTKLRTKDTNGEYDLLVWNPGDYSESLTLNSNYIFLSQRDTTCYEADPDSLPIVGDQSQIEVQLNCESLLCNFQWDIEFGCAELGVLTTSNNNGGLQVLSDVDDTVACANPSTTCDSIASCTLEGTVSHYLGGIDRRLEHKEMYPGVAELMIGLALGAQTDDTHECYPAKPMMLSARPSEAEVILAIKQDSELNLYFESVGQRQDQSSWGVNTDSSMYGTLLDGVSFTEFGQTKARSFNSVSSERPNTRFAFLADNGQGDACAAQSMLESDHGSRMEAVLIHKVIVDEEETNKDCQSPEGDDFTLDLPEGEKVHYHRTHSEAAMWSLQKGLISCCSASNVWFAVNEWIECRCEGECPPGGLNTGVSEKATRNETLSYCNEVRTDQELLLDEVNACDVHQECPLLGPIPVKSSSSASTRLGRSKGFIRALALWALSCYGLS